MLNFFKWKIRSQVNYIADLFLDIVSHGKTINNCNEQGSYIYA